MALRDSAAWLAAEGGDELARMLLRLRLWAVYYRNELAGSARQAIAAGEPLVVDFGRVLGPDHPSTLPGSGSGRCARVWQRLRRPFFCLARVGPRPGR